MQNLNPKNALEATAASWSRLSIKSKKCVKNFALQCHKHGTPQLTQATKLDFNCSHHCHDPMYISPLFCLEKTNLSQIALEDDIRDGVKDKLDVVGVSGAGKVRVDLLVFRAIDRFKL